jgi:hypothetical protein
VQQLDELGRPVISEPLKEAITGAFAAIPSNKRGAVVLIADRGSSEIRANFAAKLDEAGNWKVAAGAGWEWGKKDPSTAFVAVVGSW